MKEVEFTISCKMKDRWAIQFIASLYAMQHLGAIGSSRLVSIYSDGDGDFRPVFNISAIPEIKEKASKLLDSILEENNNKLDDIVFDAG